MITTDVLDRMFEYAISISVRVIEWIFSLYRVPESPAQVEESRVVLREKEEVPEFTFKPIGEVIAREQAVSTGVQKNTVMYAHAHRVPVFQNPTIEFDGQIGEVPYGEMVIVLEPKGRFYHIVWNTLDGWVLKGDIADRALRVYPVFVVGEENSVDHPNTAHVRTILGDPFGLARSEFPLQAGEYVLYRLWKKGVRIMWPDVRPRMPGRWHQILRGVHNVHIGVSPKVGSVMEYTFDHDMGHLAFVEAVFPDGTITLSEVNVPDSGVYNERELPIEKWKALKPLFIEVR